MKFAWANAESFDAADVVLFGVPDESGSNSQRKGVSRAPLKIREVSNEREVFERGGMKFTTVPFCGSQVSIFDMGDIARTDVSSTVEKIARAGKLPVTIGGDHSITAEVLKGLDRLGTKISVVYFDAHPDFICSSREYYGSVVCDIFDYRNIDFASSIEIGIRAPEPEELLNIRRRHLETITPLAIEEHGIRHVLEEIKRRAGEHIYVSFDVDAIDPAYAAGVSTPVPGGLSSSQALYILRKLSGMGLVGFDVMEVCPPYDVQSMTSHLAARLIMACLPDVTG